MPSPSATTQLDDLKIMLKENIELGDVVRIEAADRQLLDSYLHIQGGRGVNAVLCRDDGAPRRNSPTTSQCTSPSPGRST